MAKRFASSAFVASGNAPMLSTSIVMDASNFENLLRGLVQARARAVGLDEIIVADHGEDRGRLVAGMDREVHVLLDRHGLIAATAVPRGRSPGHGNRAAAPAAERGRACTRRGSPRSRRRTRPA